MFSQNEMISFNFKLYKIQFSTDKFKFPRFSVETVLIISLGMFWQVVVEVSWNVIILESEDGCFTGMYVIEQLENLF